GFTANGNILGDLMIGQTGNVSLNSGLTVESNLEITEGSLVLNGNDLTINGSLSTSANAGITGDVNAGLELNGSGNVSFGFTANGNILGDLMIGQTGNVTLNSGLTVETDLEITEGALVLNGNDLTINGSLSTSANAGITGDVNAGLELNGSGNVSLGFTSNGNILGDLTVSQTGGGVNLNSQLLIDNSLTLGQGNLVLSDFDLTLGLNASLEGGNNTSYVETNGTGELRLFLEAGSEGVFFPTGTAQGYFPAVIHQSLDGDNNFIGVNLASGVFAEGTTGVDITGSTPLVNHTWNISAPNKSALLDLDFQFFWNADAEVSGFNRNMCHISHFVDGNWDTYQDDTAAAEANGFFSIKRQGINSLSPFRVTSSQALGTSNAVLDEIKVYPNPALNYLNLKLPKGSQATFARIIDSKGASMGMQKLSVGSTDQKIDLSQLQPGMYFLKIDGVTTKRFVKVEMEP
ncbi:MAG: T9SS type A sorting domain-containing protein, partial [Bacteroidetes bacterium]|nr:T9SS type A sorting domain-containing protein [Bacteroidota bacterium]